MKRADLTVGADYLAHRANDWDTSSWSGPGEKVTVLDVGFWDLSHRYGYQKGTTKDVTLTDGSTVSIPSLYTTQKDGREGRCVLVRDASGKVRLRESRELRAPWEEGVARIEARDRANAEAAARRQVAQAEERRRLDALAAEIVRRTGKAPGRLHANALGAVTLPLGLLEALLFPTNPVKEN